MRDLKGRNKCDKFSYPNDRKIFHLRNSHDGRIFCTQRKLFIMHRNLMRNSFILKQLRDLIYFYERAANSEGTNLCFMLLFSATLRRVCPACHVPIRNKTRGLFMIEMIVKTCSVKLFEGQTENSRCMQFKVRHGRIRIKILTESLSAKY